MHCEYCGEKNLEESKFCKTCGHYLDGGLEHRPKTRFDDLTENERKTIFSGSWGAFAFGPIYFIAQKAYVSALALFLLLFIPGINLVIWIYYTFNAKQLAFKNRKWKNYEDFLKCQKIWDYWGKIFSFLYLLIILIWILISWFNSPTNNLSNQTNNPNLYNQTTCNEQTTIQQVKSATHTVNIYDRRNNYVSYGSGIALDSPTKNLILTNYHVIEGAYKIQVWDGYNGREMVEASVWASYPDDDIAIIKVENAFPYTISLIDSNQVKDADTLFAIGWAHDPSGDPTITKGILSRRIKEAGFEVLQTDAPINPGNSGGPLINKCGVVGMNTIKLVWSDSETPAEGTGYALSSNFISSVIYKK